MSDTPMMSEPAFNCKFPCSPCSYAHECRQIRHCSYIYKQETDELIAAEYTNQELTKKLEYAQKLMTAFGENQEKLVQGNKQLIKALEIIASSNARKAWQLREMADKVLYKFIKAEDNETTGREAGKVGKDALQKWERSKERRSGRTARS